MYFLGIASEFSSIVFELRENFSNFLNTKKRNKAIGWLSTLCAKISLYCVSFHLKYFSMLLLNYFTDKERSIGKWKPCSGNGHQSSWPKNDWTNASLQRLVQIAPAREWTRGCIKEYFGRGGWSCFKVREMRCRGRKYCLEGRQSDFSSLTVIWTADLILRAVLLFCLIFCIIYHRSSLECVSAVILSYIL